MLTFISNWLKHVAATKSVGSLLLSGLLIRLVLLIYSIYHDSHVKHIKYTDVDYHVFTNGSQAILDNRSPYEDQEYRYPPLVALIFVPNILLDSEVIGKLILVMADILCGQLSYRLNIHQGTNRVRSKLFLLVWLFNPVTLAISTRGSFEPILTLLILSSVFLLTSNQLLLAGLTYGLAIHLKLYPIVYLLCFYGYLIEKRPYMINQSKFSYWLKILRPNFDHVKFYTSSLVALVTSCYLSYRYYGEDYIEQTFIYHLTRKDLQHNFSVYFYLFKLLPQYQDQLSLMAFATQSIAILVMSIYYFSYNSNRRLKLRKLSFSLFGATFLFVSLNKVCTSQYFSWYLTFLPLILDSLDMEVHQGVWIAITWLLSQANWLLFAYLYEYQKFDVLDHVGNSSILFLLSNLWIMSTLCQSFDPSSKQRVASKTR